MTTGVETSNLGISHSDAGSISFGIGFAHDLGPACKTCTATEARCAQRERCCDTCTHRFGPGLRYPQQVAS